MSAHKSVSVYKEMYETASNTVWRPTPLDHFRVDVDAGFDDDKGFYTVGAVIRDSQGVLVAALASPIRNPSSVICGELTALIYGLIYAKIVSCTTSGSFLTRLKRCGR